MPQSLPTSVGDLPALSDLVPPEVWSADLVAASDGLFERDVRVLRDGDAGMLVLGGAAMRALAVHPAVGAAPVEFLTGRAERRVAGATEASGVAAFDAFLRDQVFTMLPPRHADVRRVLVHRLMPRAVSGMVGDAERVMAEVLDGVAGRTVDFARDVAGPYVTRFWTRQLGMPIEAAARVQQLVHEMNRMFLFAPTAQDRARMLAATEEYLELVGRSATLHLDLPEGSPGVGAFVAANFFDGFHTVAVAVANAVHGLLSEPANLERVRADPALVPAAFAEGVRLASPLMLTTRLTSDRVEHDGLRIPAGTPVTMVWIAGNRDPGVHVDPTVHRLDRRPGPGTTFGGGARVCPGFTAARMLGEVALRALTSPSVRVRLDGPDLGWAPGSGMRRRNAMPVVVETRDDDR